MNLWEAIVLGIVQGLTEFLPISSTAHLRIVPALLGWNDPGAAFTAVIQLGTLVAVLLYFFSEITAMTRGVVGGLRDGKMEGWGKITFPDGEEYEGEWLNGMKHGRGRVIFANGEEYIGQWDRNRREGLGSYTFPDGEKYVGRWHNDQMHGRGVYTYADGMRLDGYWQDSRLVSKAGEEKKTQ